MMRYITLILLFLTATHATSQILKVDKGDIDADSSHFFLGSINADFNVNNQSSTSEQEVTFKGLRAKADLVYVGSNHAYMLINNLNYFSSTGGPFVSTGFAHFRINWLRKKSLSYETFTQIQYDDGRSMPLRRLFGGGVRWSVANDRNYKLHFGVGAMHEYEEWRDRVEGGLIYKEIIKNSSYLGFKTLINELVRFNGIVYYQAGFDKESDLFRNRFSGDLSLSFSLTNNLSFSTSFSAQYEDRPIIPINNWVYSLTNGLKWDF